MILSELISLLDYFGNKEVSHDAYLNPIIYDEINLGGSIEPIPTLANIAEIAVEKWATSLFIPVSSRRELIDLSDDMATKIDIQFYSDSREVLLKAIVE